ncbi:MAG: amidohydrolase family protein [Thermoplasmatales archaeon]
MFDLVIRNGQVVFPGKYIKRTDIAVLHGKISLIGDDLGELETKKTIDATNRYVIPGVIDSHFHIGIYRPFEDDAKSESASAAAGGVTTILSYFRSGRNYMNVSENYSTLFKRVLDLSKGNFFTDYGFNLAPITKQHVEEIPELVERYGVSTFKYYMFYKGLNLRGDVKKGSVEKEYLLSDEPYDLGHLYNIMEKIASLKERFPGVRLSLHAEDSEIIRVNLEKTKRDMEELNLNPLEAYSRARPPVSERIAIIEAFEIAYETGCPIHIVHVTSKLALETINEMKRNYPSVDVTVEATPSHLTLTTDSEVGVQGKVNPPIRPKGDRDFLWSGIINNQINTVGSDHAAIESVKKGNRLWDAESGYGATELLLPALITEGHIKRKIPLEKIISLITTNPAIVHGLYGKKGDISVGFDADLVILDINKKKKVKYNELHSAQDFSPFEGLELSGWPDITILRGNITYSEGKFGDPVGEYIKRPVRMSGAEIK